MIPRRLLAWAAVDPGRWYMRDPQLAVVTCRDRVLLVRAGGRRAVDGVDAPAVSAALQQLTAPTPGQALAADGLEAVLDAMAEVGGLLDGSSAEPLEEARNRALTGSPGYHFAPGPPQCERLVVGLTGTVISGLMAPILLSLGYSGFHRELDVICTNAALRFVQPELFEYYGIRTWTDPFTRKPGLPVPHILLGKSADLLAVMPATAASLSRLARGGCEDLLSLVAAATEAPVLLGPTMNTAMWDHRPVRRNVDQLRADGFYVVEPTFFFEAAELVHGVAPACGMLGTFWGGPALFMDTVAAVLDD